MRKLFGKLNMSWLTVAIFAAITGIYSGLVMLVPALKETSFQDIGISYEWWLIFAVIVVVNCNKWWDAALKCFVFFLLSQPICYLVQIPFSAEMTFNMAFHYYYPFWFVMTLLTIPGGLVAYFCKKQNALGAVILGLGNTIQAIMAVSYTKLAFVTDFPHHLITFIVCIVSIFVMTFSIQTEKKNRIISIAIPVVLTAAIFVLCILTGRTMFA